MVMKTTINIDIECTPAEARAFLGLPDVEPIQAPVMEGAQEPMLEEIDKFPPESLINQWVSAFPQNAERMQEMFAKMFMAGLGEGRHFLRIRSDAPCARLQVHRQRAGGAADRRG